MSLFYYLGGAFLALVAYGLGYSRGVASVKRDPFAVVTRRQFDDALGDLDREDRQ